MKRLPALAVLSILACGVLCAWPLLAGGGWYTYQDNPCHLAELHDLGQGSSGWSDAAFLGFSVFQVHSPLWFGLLGLLSGLGVPAGLLVVLFDLAGFLAPALAVFISTRRRTPLWAATLIAWLVLIQRPWLAGFESPLGGMAPFGLAAAGLVLLVDLLSRDEDTPARLLMIGLLYGFIGLTHLFLLAPSVLLFLLAAAGFLRHPAGRRLVGHRLAAACCGALISAPYWLPALLERATLIIRDQALAPHLGLLYLVLPLHPLALAEGRLQWQSELFFTDALPMILILGLGVLGFWRARRDRTGRLGLWLALAIAVLVLLVVPLSGRPLLGPHSWRRLMLVRLGLALAAGPVLASLPALQTMARQRVIVITVGIAMALSGLWWQRSLSLETPPRDHAEVTQLARTWEWLRRHRPQQAGRLYVQDTFYLSGDKEGLFHSHLPALTARETGWDQVGAFYGGMVFPIEDWTDSQFGRLFGQPLLDTDQLLRVGTMIPRAGVTRLLLTNPVLAHKMTATGIYQEVFKSGRFTVVDPVPTIQPSWYGEGTRGVELTVLDRRPGHWRITVTSPSRDGQVVMNLAWSRAWNIEGAPGVTMTSATDGRLVLGQLPAGTTNLELHTHGQNVFWGICLLGISGLMILSLWFRRHRTHVS